MSETVSPINPTSSVSSNTVHLEGKIDRIEPYEGKQYTEVILPAADEYSPPSRAKIVSTRALGSIGQKVSVPCTVRGFVQTFQITKGARQGQQGRDVKTWFVPVGDIG